MKKQIFFTILVTYMISGISCSKDPAPAESYYFMDQEFKDYTFFRQGSWWVYKKDTATFDSIAVLSSQMILQEPDSADYSWQQSRMGISSSYYSDTIMVEGDFIKPASIFYIKEISDTSETLGFFSLKPQGYELSLSPSLKMLYRETKDTTLNGVPFGAVKIFENTSVNPQPGDPKELWYARNIGLIRKELFNGEVWFLDRYQIVQ